MKKGIYFLLVFILGIVFSCSEDDFTDSGHSSHHLEQNMRKNKVTFAEMKQFLKEHSNNSSLPKSLAVADKNGNSYITSIDITNVTFITDDNVASFTLRINTLDDENYGFSNLVVKSYNGQTEEYIYHYNPDAEWLTAFNSGEKRDYEGEIFVTDIDGNNLSSFTNYSKGTIGALCFATIEIPCYGSECPCTDGNGQTIVKIFACNGENNSGGNGNGNGSTPPGGFPPTDPTPPGGGTNYSDFDYFIMGLSPAQKAWFVASANSTIFNNVHSYLYNQDYSWEAVELMTWAIGFFMENPGTTWTQFENWFIKAFTQQDIINELQNYPCAQSIVQELPNLSNDIALKMRDIFQNSDNYHIIFRAKSGLGNIDGETRGSYSNTGTFRAVIDLNDEVLQNATKEYILITMYHEVVHAFLDYERYRLGNTSFQNTYPYVLVGYDYDSSGNIVNRYTFLSGHNQLGAFLTQLENILSSYNPNLPQETIKAIAKAGITTMTSQESQLNRNERNTLLNNYKGTKCP